jgi:hypothetical protein
VTADILIREDTGSFAVVRVIDPGVHVSAPYSRAIGLLDRWVAAERRAVDEYSAWIEGQVAQAHAEMRLLCDELGLPFVFAELPPSSEWPELAAFLAGADERVNLPKRRDDPAEIAVRLRRGWTPPRRPSDVLAEAYQERADAAEAYMRADSSDEMPGRDADGWTPTRPVIVVDIPAPDLVQTGPQSRFGRWFDEQLQRAEQWWRGKQAARDERLGVGDE